MNDNVTTPYYASPKKHVSQKRIKHSSNVEIIQSITVRFHLALFITKQISSFPASLFPARPHFTLLSKKKCFKDRDMQFLTTDTGQGINSLSLTLRPHMVHHKVSLPNLLNQTSSGTFAVSETIFWSCILLKSHWGILETHSGVQRMLNQGPDLSLTWEEVMLLTLKSKGKQEKQSTCYQPLLLFLFLNIRHFSWTIQFWG